MALSEPALEVGGAGGNRGYRFAQQPSLCLLGQEQGALIVTADKAEGGPANPSRPLVQQRSQQALPEREISGHSPGIEAVSCSPASHAPRCSLACG